jgi:hypothetical protein
MTPKEKATELIEKFKDKVNPYIGSGMLSNTHDDSAILWQSKKCAQIVCDEAQEILNKPMFQYKESLLWKAEFEYWDKVRDELSAL